MVDGARGFEVGASSWLGTATENHLEEGEGGGGGGRGGEEGEEEGGRRGRRRRRRSRIYQHLTFTAYTGHSQHCTSCHRPTRTNKQQHSTTYGQVLTVARVHRWRTRLEGRGR